MTRRDETRRDEAKRGRRSGRRPEDAEVRAGTSSLPPPRGAESSCRRRVPPASPGRGGCRTPGLRTACWSPEAADAPHQAAGPGTGYGPDARLLGHADDLTEPDGNILVRRRLHWAGIAVAFLVAVPRVIRELRRRGRRRPQAPRRQGSRSAGPGPILAEVHGVVPLPRGCFRRAEFRRGERRRRAPGLGCCADQGQDFLCSCGVSPICDIGT